MATISRWESADKVVADEEAERDAAAGEVAEGQKAKVVLNLSSHVETRWQIGQKSKIEVESIFISALRARRREYSVQMLQALKIMFGDDYIPVFAPIIETKCSAGESWIKEIFFQKGERPWDVNPTPLPELPNAIKSIVEQTVKYQLMVKNQQEFMDGTADVQGPDEISSQAKALMPMANEKVSKIIMDLAKRSAEKVGTRIEDMFAEGGWGKALNDCIYDIVTFGTMIMKGPFVRREVVSVRDFNPDTGRWETKIEQRLKEYWARVNPFDFYPLPGTTNPQNGDFCEVVRMTRQELSDLIGVKGWDEAAIRDVLRAYRTGGYLEWKTNQTERLHLEGKNSGDLHEDDGIDCIEYHGSAPGELLLSWGMSKTEVPDEDREYDIVAWKIGPHVIRAMINPNALGGRPYYTAGFREIPDSFWHVGIPQLAESAQTLGNAVFRSLAINVAIASGPQIEVDVERLDPGESFRMWPYRVWKSTNQQLREGQAVNFFQPTIVTSPLMDVFEFCLRMADEDTGVPRYAHGDPKTSGAGSTSSGLAMMMSQSAKGIKMVVRNIDEGVISQSVEFAYNHILQYEQDFEVVGDMKCVATGSYALMAREQQAIRRTEFLVQTANEFDMQVMGVGGRAELIRQALRSLDIDPEKVVKEQQELDKLAMGLQAAPPQNDAGAGAAPTPTPLGMTPGAPPPAPVSLDGAGQPVAGRDSQLFESQPGVTP